MIPTPFEFWTLNNTLVGAVGGNTLVSGDGLDHYIPGKIGAGLQGRVDEGRDWSTDLDGLYQANGEPASLAVWLRSRQHDPFRLALGLGPDNGGLIVYSYDGVLYCSYGYSIFSDPIAIPLNVWVHLVLVLRNVSGGARFECWLDGILVFAAEAQVSLLTAFPRVRLGGSSIAESVYMDFDAVGVWRVPLTDAEILELHASGDGAEYPFVLPDNTPDDFDVADVTDADLSTEYISDSQQITGMDAGTAISVTGGEYRLDGGAWTSDAGTINPGQTLELRATSSSDPETPVTVSVTIGTVTADWTITTAAAISVITNILHGSTPETSRILRSRIVQGVI